MSSTYKAKLDSFDLTILSSGTNDSWEKNLAEYEIPFSSGAKLDPMGIKRRPINFTCVFEGENYSTHEFFVQHVIQDLINTLIHPVYGSIKGAVKGISVRNTDAIKYAEVDIDFVEDADESAVPAYSPSIEYVVEQTFLSAQVKQCDQLTAQIRSTVGSSAADSVLSVKIDSNKSIVSQFPKVSWVTRNFISNVATIKSVFDSKLMDITNPAESIISTVEYGTSLPGVLLKSIAQCVERYAYAAEQVNQSPLAFVSSFNNGINELAQSAGLLKKHVLITASQIASIFTVKLLAVDDKANVELDRIESSKIWNAAGTMVYSPVLPAVLSVNDLERSLYINRSMIQIAIDAIRSESGSPELIYSLKKIAADLQLYVNKTKLDRDKIVTIELDSEMPLHAICLRYGLPYMYAERICSINRFWNPSFCSGKVQIYVR